MLKAGQNIVGNLTKKVPKKHQTLPIFTTNSFRLNINQRWFCTGKESLKNSQQTFDLIVNHLREKVEHIASLEQTLIEETNKVNSSINKEQVRIEISQLAPVITIY